MSSETRHTPCNSHLLPESSSQHPQSSSNPLFNFNIPSFRRSVDLRRPIMSQSTQHFIDLTEDGSSPLAAQTIPPTFTHSEGQRGAQRPPRFDRDIISIDDQEDEAVDLREDSPEIQFLTSRPRSRSLSTTRHARHQSTLRQRRHTPVARSPVRRPQVSLRITGAPAEAHGHQNAGWLFHPFAARVNTNTPRLHEDGLVEWGNYPSGNFELPEHLDYIAPAFNLDNPARRQPQPRVPTYDPPAPAEEGFTRTPNENDMLVCPNCDDELGLGVDEVKRQVWVVKACGHVCVIRFIFSTQTNSDFRSTVASVQRIGLPARNLCFRLRQNGSNHSQSALWKSVGRVWRIRKASFRCTCDKGLSCMRLRVLYHSAISTAIGVGLAFRARIV